MCHNFITRLFNFYEIMRELIKVRNGENFHFFYITLLFNSLASIDFFPLKNNSFIRVDT